MNVVPKCTVVVAVVDILFYFGVSSVYFRSLAIILINSLVNFRFPTPNGEYHKPHRQRKRTEDSGMNEKKRRKEHQPYLHLSVVSIVCYAIRVSMQTRCT